MLQKSLVRRGSKKIRHNAGRLPKKPVYIINLMYAIVEINGQQFKAEEGKKLFVHHIKDVEAGQTVEFDKVLLVDKDGSIIVGAQEYKLTYFSKKGCVIDCNSVFF
jgi:large subunit ribosomal protein L21